MRNGIKYTAVMVCLLALSAGAQSLLANCTHFGAGFPIFQCGFTGWFAPQPAGIGTVSGVWWQIGYGNLRNNQGFGGGALEGTGAGPVGQFTGNDSGNFQLSLTDARSVLTDPGVPAGARCSNFENGWAQPGVDGCADNPRTTADDDNLLNPFFNRTYGPGAGYYTTNYQLDYPMGVLLRESNGNYFSIAFVANKSRGTTQAQKDADSSEGFFDLAEVANGDTNPVSGKLNQIPWQKVPKPVVDQVTFPSGSSGPRMVNFHWDNVRQVSDLSTRPSTGAPALVAGGVGVLNFGSLVRYVIETAPVTSTMPDPATLTWTTVSTMPAPPTGSTVNTTLTVNPDTAIRVRTLLGRVPRTTSTLAASTRLGASGDLCIEATLCDGGSGATCPVSPPLTIIGGPLSAQGIADLAAVKLAKGGGVKVTFRTIAELGLSSISVLGKGGAVLAKVDAKQGNTGLGENYEVIISNSALKGAKEISVRLDDTGFTSAPVPIQ